MAIAVKGLYQRADQAPDEELLFVASYLEKSIDRSIIITDHNGLIHYPKLVFTEHNDVLINIPLRPTENKYLYNEADSVLYYPIIYSFTIAYIVIKDLPVSKMVKTLDVLAEAKLAIKYYFTNHKKTEQSTLRLHNQLIEHLFYPDKKNINDIIRQNGQSLNTQLAYFAVVLEFGNIIDEGLKRKICAYSNDYLWRKKKDTLQLSYSKYLILIIADHFSVSDYRTNPNYFLLRQHKEALQKQFNNVFCEGIGTPYAFSDIKKSFNEAMIALKLPTLMGQNSYSQLFSDLGIFTQIFKQDPDILIDYCSKTLAPLLDYDKTNNGCLINTLRQLLDYNLNYKVTAESLYIHINTLYYRKNKIEELLGLDISLMNNLVNLYIAIKLWDLAKL